MALSSCRWFVPGRSLPMEFRSMLRSRLLSQLTINLGKPPDHAGRSTTFDNNSLVPSILHYQLRERGAQFVASDRMVVHHAQQLTLSGHSAVHFHNARSTAGFLCMVAPESAWLAGYVVLLPKMIWRTLAVGLGKRRYRRELFTGVPLIVWLVCCHGAGELIGHFAGPGRSPQRVN